MPARIRSARHVDSGPDLFANIYIRSSSSSSLAHKPDPYTATAAAGSSSAIMESSTANGVLIGLLSSFGSALFIALVFLVVYFFRYTQGGRILLDRIGRPGEYDDEQSFLREEAEALETMEEGQRIDYLRAKGMSWSVIGVLLGEWEVVLVTIADDMFDSLYRVEPAGFITYRYLAVTIPGYPREGRVSMGVRT